MSERLDYGGLQVTKRFDFFLVLVEVASLVVGGVSAAGTGT